MAIYDGSSHYSNACLGSSDFISRLLRRLDKTLYIKCECIGQDDNDSLDIYYLNNSNFLVKDTYRNATLNQMMLGEMIEILRKNCGKYPDSITFYALHSNKNYNNLTTVEYLNRDVVKIMNPQIITTVKFASSIDFKVGPNHSLTLKFANPPSGTFFCSNGLACELDFYPNQDEFKKWPECVTAAYFTFVREYEEELRKKQAKLDYLKESMGKELQLLYESGVDQ